MHRRKLLRPVVRRPVPLAAIIVSMLVGSLITYMLLAPIESSSPRSADASGGGSWNLLAEQVFPSTTTRSALEVVDDDNRYKNNNTSIVSTSSSHPGWHPIHVFFGNETGLGVGSDEKWFSQVHQDEIVVDLVGENGFFIDLAANDAKFQSNTLALERLGWKGICVEPNPIYWYGLSHRKCTVIGALVGLHKEEVTVKFRGVYGGIVGKMDDKLANRKGEPPGTVAQRFTVPFADVLEHYQVPSIINYMSLDVEGAEMAVMKGFPFDKYMIQIMTVERPSRELRTLLNEHGYVFLKDLAWWGETLWAHSSTGFNSTHPKIANIIMERRH